MIQTIKFKQGHLDTITSSSSLTVLKIVYKMSIEMPQSQNIACQWHQGEEQTNQVRQYTSPKSKKSWSNLQIKEKQSKQLPLLQQGDYNTGQDPLKPCPAE